MNFPREGGILLHPTSLPGPHGSGDFGPAAFRFVDWLADAGQRLWQLMPLGPTGYGDSPYSSPSAFAGNPLLISLDWLAGDGLLDRADLESIPAFNDASVAFGEALSFKERMLRRAFAKFLGEPGNRYRDEYDAFLRDQSWWLVDFAQFVAIKQKNDLIGWRDWDEGLRLRDAQAMRLATSELAEDIAYHQFVQFVFDRQWKVLRRYANDRSVRIVGDIPIFVAEDSADVWANQQQFRIDETGNPEVVAGVPPDPFSATGQIWGNPLYDWDAMRENGFQWWEQRIRRTTELVDIVRIDHFRGFAATWAVPSGATTAAEGHWERAPGGELFAAIRRELGELPIVIEDLGVITPDVISLREILGFPGMNVLQFAFENDPENVYLPHNYQPHSVVYTATHDNQTTVGWFTSRSAQEQADVQQYIGRDGSDIAWDLIRLALGSVANTCIIPLQDVLRLDDSARMNVPGQPEGNWSWRFQENDLTSSLAHGLRTLTHGYGRTGGVVAERPQNPWDYTNPHGRHQATLA